MNKKIKIIFIIFIIFYFICSISIFREGQDVIDSQDEAVYAALSEKDRDKLHLVKERNARRAKTKEEQWKSAVPNMPPPPANFSKLKPRKQQEIMEKREKIFEMLYKIKKKKEEEQYKKDAKIMAKDSVKKVSSARDELSSLQALLGKAIGGGSADIKGLSDIKEVPGTPIKSIISQGNWKVKPSMNGDLVFLYGGKEVAKISSDGELSSLKRKCGMWNLRDSRIGIKGRNDLNLHTDGWFRVLNYDSPEISAGLHKFMDYKKGGFAGKELWYGGSVGGKLHRG